MADTNILARVLCIRASTVLASTLVFILKYELVILAVDEHCPKYISLSIKSSCL